MPQGGSEYQKTPALREDRINQLRVFAALYAHTPYFALAWDEVFALRAQQLNEQREQERSQ